MTHHAATIEHYKCKPISEIAAQTDEKKIFRTAGLVSKVKRYSPKAANR